MIRSRLELIFTQDEMHRLSIDEASGSTLKIVADVHGMKCFQAKRFINNIINIVRATFRLVIIHGFNHGTAIKDMLAGTFTNTHIVERHLDTRNRGVTHMLIAA